MPGNILNADTGFPQFTGSESNEQKLDKVMNYLYMLLEQLRYTLNNLDSDNFNETGLKEIAEGISRPLATSFESELVRTNAVIEGWSDEFGSQISSLVRFQKTVEDGTISSIASIKAEADANGASISQLVSWQKTADEEIDGLVSTTAVIKAEADANGASIEQIVTAVGEDGEVTAASIAAAVSEDESLIRLIADKVEITGFVTYKSLENDGGAYINGNNVGLVSDSDGNSTASLRFWLGDDVDADENDYLIGEIYTSGTYNDLADCTLCIKTSFSNMKITSGGDLDVSSAGAVSLESGTSYMEIIANGSVEIYSGDNTLIDCDYITIIPSVSYSSSRGVDYAWQFFEDGIYFNGYKMVSTPS